MPRRIARIADHLGIERTNVQHRIAALEDQGAVIRTPKGYALVTETTPLSSIPSLSSHLVSDGSDGGYKDYPASAWETD